MKKLILAALVAAATLIIAPVSVKADAAFDYAQNFKDMQINWAGDQWAYFGANEVPVMGQYGVAMANQFAQGLAAAWQSDVMARQAQARIAANQFQLLANEYAHQQNLATQYTNMKTNVTYDAINNWDTSFYNNQEMVLRTYGMMFGQYPFPQVQ